MFSLLKLVLTKKILMFQVLLVEEKKKKRSLKRKWRFITMEIYVIAINWGYYTRFLMIEIYVIYFPFSNWMFLIKDRDTWDWNPNIQRSFRNKLQYLVFMLNYNEMMIVINKKIFNNNSYSIIFPCNARVNG